MDNVAIVRRYTEECWGRGNLDLVDELVAPDARAGHGDPGSGPQAYKDEILAIRNGLSDYRTTVEEIFGAGEAVAVRWSTTGRHTGPLFGHPATDKENPGLASGSRHPSVHARVGGPDLLLTSSTIPEAHRLTKARKAG